MNARSSFFAPLLTALGLLLVAGLPTTVRAQAAAEGATAEVTTTEVAAPSLTVDELQAQLDAHPLEGPAALTLTGAALLVASPFMFVGGVTNLCISLGSGSCVDDTGWEILTATSVVAAAGGLAMLIAGSIWWANNDAARRRLGREIDARRGARLELRPLLTVGPDHALGGLSGRF